MANYTQIIRTDLKDFTAYRATANREELGGIWLNSNESPFNLNGDSTIALNRYPHRWPKNILASLADYYKAPQEQLLLSRGSDEAIDLIIRLCCEAGKDSILISPPTFHIYEVYAKLQNAKIVNVPLRVSNQFDYPIDEVLSLDDASVKVIFICSPNNPTGNLISFENIEKLCHRYADRALVVVDEAYIEFSEMPSAICLLSRFPNLVILRTLSKAFALAGVRCGITLANIELIQWLKNISAPYPLPSPCIEIVQERLSIANQQKTLEHIQIIIRERERIFQKIALSPHVIKAWPGKGNFLLIETTDAEKFIECCLKQGVIVRNYSKEIHLKNCIRISIGSPTENNKLLEAIT